MIPAVFEKLVQLRHRVVERRDLLAQFESGAMRCWTNDVDDSADFIERLRGWIANDESLISAFDPDGLTALEPAGENG